MKLAPITLFVYNRIWHTQKTIEALQKNTLALDSDLIIFSDGPKDSLESKKDVTSLREYLKTISGFKSIKIIERSENRGLADSIISGVTEVINQYGNIIVLEDDMVSSRYFLEYVNNGLNLYENDENVISIHSYIYPTVKKLPETFFIKGADCWGWATWKRGWDLFESDGKKLLDELESSDLTKEFNFDNSYSYTKMLQDQIAGRNSSWAIRWYASAFLKNKLTLYPRESLIYNTGFDNSGTHCGDENNFNKTDDVENVKIRVERIEIKENYQARRAISNYFKKENNICIKSLRYFKKKLNHVFKN